jgi:uncharacterized protein DUF4352
MPPDQRPLRPRSGPPDPRLSRRVAPPRPPRPIRKARPWPRAGLVISIAVAVGALIILFGMGAAAQNIGRDAARPAAPGTSSTRTTGTLRHPVRDGKFEFVVLGVNCSRSTVGVEHLSRTAVGKYCVISLSIRNIAGRPQLFLGRLQKVFDAGGTEFDNDEAAGLFANHENQTFLRKIDPGHQVRGKIVFDVPKGTELTAMELHDSYFSGGVRVALA